MKLTLSLIFGLGMLVALYFGTDPFSKEGGEVITLKKQSVIEGKMEDRVRNDSKEILSVVPDKTSLLRPAIEERYQGNLQKQAAAFQLAGPLLKILDPKADAEEIMQQLNRASACRALTFEANEGRALGLWLEDLIFNTDQKSEIYIEWNSRWNGRLLKLSDLNKEDVCDTY